MPHVPQRFRSIKTQVTSGPDVPPPPVSHAPFNTEGVQPDLMDIFDDLPVTGEPLGRDKSKVPHKASRPEKNSLMGSVNIREFDVNPADIEQQLIGG